MDSTSSAPLDNVSFEPTGPPCFDDVTISKGISTPFVDQAIFVALSFVESYVQKAKKLVGCLMVILLLNRSDIFSERKQNYCSTENHRHGQSSGD